jgi:hypothetical protein
MAYPLHDFLLVAPLGCEIQVVVGADQHVQAAGISGIRVEDFTRFVAIEDAKPWEFFFSAVGFFVVVG